MIYQLPSGRIIHLSLEQFLEMTDEELKELNCLGSEYTAPAPDPFYHSALHHTSNKNNKPDVDESEEREPSLDEIKDIEKLGDEYFHRDDT